MSALGMKNLGFTDRRRANQMVQFDMQQACLPPTRGFIVFQQSVGIGRAVSSPYAGQIMRRGDVKSVLSGAMTAIAKTDRPDTLLKPSLRSKQQAQCLIPSVTLYALTFLINGVTTPAFWIG
jgi:hypothetical protein